MANLIVFDVGNTDTVVGFFKGSEIFKSFRIKSLKSENSVFFEYRILNFMLESNIEKEDLSIAVISSVVPILTPFFSNFCEKFLDIKAKIVEPAKSNLLKIDLDIPEELGADLFLNALAAHTLYGGNCLVVDFGTALTFTTVSKEGVILGGNIVPGIGTALKSLFSQTSLLPEVKLQRPETIIGKGTMHAIQGGIYYGYESLIRGIVSKIKEEVNQPLKVIATGGLSSIITDLDDLFDERDKGLTLKGMYIFGTK